MQNEPLAPSSVMDESVSAPTDTPDESPRDDAHSQSQSQSGSKAPASKDKHCPYCRQAFTSSSLGRHLDQYLLKKKPDGVHDVDEIRRIRGGITRRQARTSSGRRDSMDTSASTTKPSEPRAAVVLNGKPTAEGYVRMMFNTPTWHTTGVINDIPTSPSTLQDRAVSGPGPERVSMPQATNTVLVPESGRVESANPDTARALELALREVLDNVKAATVRAQPRLSPFEFDLQSQSFPELCLQVLSPPPSLFSAQPFSSPNSFPLEPPGVSQLDIVRQNLCAQIEQWKTDQLASVDATAQSGAGRMGFVHANVNIPQDPGMISRTARQHEDMTVRHLDLALKHWTSLPRGVQQETWQLEITRAFAREIEKRKRTDAQLVRVQQEANQLRAQVDRLGSCQWPREFAIFPPDTLPIPRDVAGELDTGFKVGSSRWDYDNVVAKWKRVVMHDTAMGKSGTNHSHMSAIDDRKSNNKRHGTNNSNTNRSKVGTPTASSARPGSPLEARGQHSTNQQTSSYTQQDSKRNSNLGPQPKRQRLLNGQAKSPDHTGGDDATNGTSGPGEHNLASRSVSSPALTKMPPPHTRPTISSPTNQNTPSFRPYRSGTMDVDADEDDADADADVDADGEADADGDLDGDGAGDHGNGDHRPDHRTQQQQSQEHGGRNGGSGSGNFDGPQVLMDMRSRGAQSQGYAQVHGH